MAKAAKTQYTVDRRAFSTETAKQGEPPHRRRHKRRRRRRCRCRCRRRRHRRGRRGPLYSYVRAAPPRREQPSRPRIERPTFLYDQSAATMSISSPQIEKTLLARYGILSKKNFRVHTRRSTSFRIAAFPLPLRTYTHAAITPRPIGTSVFRLFAFSGRSSPSILPIYSFTPNPSTQLSHT